MTDLSINYACAPRRLFTIIYIHIFFIHFSTHTSLEVLETKNSKSTIYVRDRWVPGTGTYEDVLWLIHRSERCVVILNTARTLHLWRRCVSASVYSTHTHTHITCEAIKLNDKIMFGIEWTYVFLSTSYSNCAFENIPVALRIFVIYTPRWPFYMCVFFLWVSIYDMCVL